MLLEKREVVSFSHGRISGVPEINLSADQLVSRLLLISKSEPVFILDSCGVGHLGSHLMIAGVRPKEIVELVNDDPEQSLHLLDEKLGRDHAAIFTLSYDFGIKLQPVSTERVPAGNEPDIFIALFDALLVHDYDSGTTQILGEAEAALRFRELIENHRGHIQLDELPSSPAQTVTSNFTKAGYIAAIERIREYIRSGDTYQTNLTQQLTCDLLPDVSPESIFWRLRRDHPAPFSAFLRRPESTVVSASPERFFRVSETGIIEASPIKGTRRRGEDAESDLMLRTELLSSEKDRAENTMIVDLLRNDLGRVCEFGTVEVTNLCDLEEHPTLFHLVSTIRGSLRAGMKFSDILRATFPCGSITGAPKVRTMDIIAEIEKTCRGLSMGAIGAFFPPGWEWRGSGVDSVFDVSVAIRTMVIRDNEVVFNVGGGVVIDSDPEKEFEESLLKAQALLTALGASYRG